MKASRNNFHAAGFGKVAPWVDLANSEEWNGFGTLTDHLTNATWLATFLNNWNLHPLASKDVPRRKLVQLRALLRRAAEKLAAGGSLNRREPPAASFSAARRSRARNCTSLRRGTSFEARG